MRKASRKIKRSMDGGIRWALHIFCLAIAVGIWGCASESFSPDAAPENIITVEFAPFYRLGPQQARGPDLSLRRGTRVKLLRREMGYSFVQMEDSRTGYIANENMAVAPPRPKEAESVASSGSSGMSRKPGSRQRGESSPVYSGPQINDTPLPDPNVPPPDLNIDPELVSDTIPVPAATPEGTPKFRY